MVWRSADGRFRKLRAKHSGISVQTSLQDTIQHNELFPINYFLRALSSSRLRISLEKKAKMNSVKIEIRQNCF